MDWSVPTARAVLTRLGTFLDDFAGCFGRRAQRDGASRYVHGLLNDSERKSMQPMDARLPDRDAGSYQRLQHFATHAPWAEKAVWRKLRAKLRGQRGTLLVDESGLPKAGTRSVGAIRQYCGTLGKIANCQVMVSTAVRIGRSVWPTTMELYLPKEWAEDETRRARAGIPPTLAFREKWRIALDHIRQVRAAGIHLTAVLADAAYGNVTAFRTALVRMGLWFALGVGTHLTVQVLGGRRRLRISRLLRRLPTPRWRRICWAQGTKGPLAARFAALRVQPTPTSPLCWLLCERPLTPRGERKAYLLNLPATASLTALVRLARGRWPIEQHYRELKDDLGLDHYEGRSYRGWNHHAVLTAVAFTFLQRERARHTEPMPTLPEIRTWVQEIVATLYLVENPKWLKLAVSFMQDPPKILRPRPLRT